MKFFPAAQEVIAAAMFDGRDTPTVGNWQEHPQGYHIQQAMKHLTLLQQGYNRGPHLTQAVLRLLMTLEYHLLAACNGNYIPQRRCSRCRRAKPLPGQWACRACLTAYQRERRIALRPKPLSSKAFGHYPEFARRRIEKLRMGENKRRDSCL
jgi:hypothetical protein